jgi:response regulator RpfG family c-di-GMP phosphodiesterase
MSTDEFTKLFTYMEKRFTELEAKMDKRFDDTNTRIDQIMSLLDTLAKQQEINEDERLVMRHHLERLDQWVHQLAEKIGVKLSA